MRLPATIFTLVATLLTAPTFADSDSTSGSCSGTIHPYGYFYAYTYQYANLSNDKLIIENHNFTFTGFIKDIKDATIVRANNTHVIYRTRDFLLAVPYKAGKGLHVKPLHDTDPALGPMEEFRNGWIQLCDY